MTIERERPVRLPLEAGCKVHWKPNLRDRPGMLWPDEYPIGAEL